MNQKVNLITTLGMCCLLSACQCSEEKKAETVAEPVVATATMPATKESSTMTTIKTPSNLEYMITREGDAAARSVKKGDNVTVHYTGHIYNADKTLGTKFDSSVDRNQPFTFKIGYNTVIKGWEEGILDMKIGEKRTLIIPAELGYGARGAGSKIPGGATLHFEVELLNIS